MKFWQSSWKAFKIVKAKTLNVKRSFLKALQNSFLKLFTSLQKKAREKLLRSLKFKDLAIRSF